MKIENIKFKAKELGTGEWKEGFLQRDMDYNLCILVANEEDHSWYWTQIDPSTVCMVVLRSVKIRASVNTVTSSTIVSKRQLV